MGDPVIVALDQGTTSTRAIVFDAKDRLPVRALGHCIGLALTHHLRKKTQRKRTGSKKT